MIQKPTFGILFLTGVLFLQACVVDGFETSEASLTTEESLIAGQIIGESLSENNDGLLSSFSEAFAIPGPTTLEEGPSALVSGDFRSLENYTYSFDPTTGKHTATFTTRVVSDLLQTQTEYELTYTFFDAGGGTLATPTDQKDLIAAVDFRAVRNGEIESATKRSTYTRTDRLLIDGISESSDILAMDGYHFGQGLFTQILNGTAQREREYFLDLNYLDIRINKPIVIRNRNFRTGVNGAFSYENTITQTGNGNRDSDTKIVNGTVELNGDGTALLKFREQVDPYRLRLENGDVFDDDEFEGRVISVHLGEQIFTLSNGQRIQLQDPSVIDVQDFATLEEVANAVDRGVRVIAEGEYYQPDEGQNLWIATEVEFELESIEFEDLVASVNLTDNSFTLASGDRFFITNRSEVEFDEGMSSLQDVVDAIDQGVPVTADVDVSIDIETGRYMVKEVDFEFEFDEFEGQVVQVDREENTFTLESGNVVLITDRTMIDEEGDFSTLEEVADALDEGIDVEADGDFYPDPQSGYWLAVEVEFLAESDDD